MTTRKVHLRPATVVYLGRTRTFCGKTIYSAPADMSGAVVTFGGSGGAIDATVQGALVTCPRCVPGTQHRRGQGQ